jgi:hypothetical protein
MLLEKYAHSPVVFGELDPTARRRADALGIDEKCVSDRA